MNEDDNTNVRLAAVSALARFADEMQVRKALLGALENSGRSSSHDQSHQFDG